MAGEAEAIMLQQVFFLLLMIFNQRRQRMQRRRRLRRFVRDRRVLGLNPAALAAAIVIAQGGPQIYRSVWTRERSHHWFQHIVLETYTDIDFYRRFRMRKAIFRFIVTDLQHVLHRSDTRLRAAIPVPQRIAIALYWLASGDLLRTVADLFGVSAASVCHVVHDVCQAIVDVLLPRYLTFPSGERLRETVQGYGEKWGFPQCAGAVDGSHIAIKAPVDGRTDFFNRKGYYSIILQGVVDHLFTDINVGWPGSVHDARVLRNSSIFERAERGTCTNIPAVILGDAAYPHLPWLMKAYPDNGHLTREQLIFNYRLSRARMTVECAFGRLKGRWRCLSKRLDVDLDHVPTVVTACCVLHNVCEVHGEHFDDQWLVPADDRQVPMQRCQAVPNASRDALARLFVDEE
ncbi:protein ANTAGONIST OF LIKE HETEROCHROMATIN PROTEIN 1-like [Branchiostoma floridae]|uniref:Protein ANTAGONIST OF LIKE HETEROCHROMATIN PROTEIN 1-like n=1 Tax=Branchiostoma floridae TaxID=7739 RepID=A0A9J7M171_BRAFL|nr:protein ANTAGONIST OF LIKE HETEROCHROMATIN PROTEIN 1-like [Branchiostoma floridae]